MTMQEIIEEVFTLLKNLDWKLCSIESFTGGLFSSTVCSVPGASEVFEGALVTYQNEIKEKLAGIDPEILDKFGAVSRECAEMMALAGLDIFESEVSVAFTGNAGPTAMEGKPAGLVYLAIALLTRVYCFEFYYDLERNELREQAVFDMFYQLSEILREVENA